MSSYWWCANQIMSIFYDPFLKGFQRSACGKNELPFLCALICALQCINLRFCGGPLVGDSLHYSQYTYQYITRGKPINRPIFTIISFSKEEDSNAYSINCV